MSETWLNGWSRCGDTVLIGSTVHCAGCGKDLGICTVAVDDNWQRPDKLPDWPFAEDCPICELNRKTKIDFSDKLAARSAAMKILREENQALREALMK